MDVRPDAKASPVPMIVGIVGGALLIIGSFLAWATGSFDPSVLAEKLASALGVDPALIQGQIPAGFSDTVSGLDADGKITLVFGLVVVVLAVLVFLKADLSRILGGLIIAAGVIGAGVAIYDLVTLNNEEDKALGSLSAAVSGLGVDAAGFGDAFKVSAGIGIWVCILGGLVAIVAGVLALMHKGAATPATASAGVSPAPEDGGFGSTMAPSAPVVTTPPAPDMTESPSPDTPPAPHVSAPAIPEPATPEPPSIPEPATPEPPSISEPATPEPPSVPDMGDGGSGSTTP